MSIERNIAFIYPISLKLQELKRELEQDEGVIVYELDSVAEYGQLIGVMEHAITFSSDLKKTETYLNDYRKMVKVNTSKNFLVQTKEIPPHIFSKFQKLGLNEIIQETASLKSILHKVKFFFDSFDQKIKQEEEAKNKEIIAQMSVGSAVNKGKEEKKEKYNSSEKLRIEKMASMDEEIGVLKSNKKKSSFDHDALLSNSAFSSFELKSNKTAGSFLKSPFDSLQRKKLATFDPVMAKAKLKKASFVPVEQEYGNNPYKSLGIKKTGEIKKRKNSGIEFAEQEMNKRKINFKEVERELNKRKINFEQVERELNRKRHKLLDLENQLKRKKITRFDEVEKENKKRKKFNEVLKELEKKSIELGMQDKEIGKKKKLFEEVEAELNKKKNALEDNDLDLEKKKGLSFELEELQKKKGIILDDLESLARKKKKFIEVELEKTEYEKLGAELESDLEKKKGSLGDELDYTKKKGLSLDESGNKKKKTKFEEVDLDRDKKNNAFDEQTDLNEKEHGKFEEVKNKKDQETLELPENEYNKKNGSFEEVKKENILNLGSKVKIGEKDLDENDLDKKNKKKYEEEILDYGAFKKQYKEGKLDISEEKSAAIQKKVMDKILEEPEYKFFENSSFGLEYLIIHNDFLLKENTSTEGMFKFIHFALLKEYGGDISFYLAKEIDNTNKTDAASAKEEPKYQSISLYCGHKARGNEVLGGDFDAYQKLKLERWLDCRLPYWADETYQIETNEFIYPYFEDGKYLGFAVSHFKNTVNSHDDASKIELLAMCLKGSVIDEHLKGTER